MKYIVDPTTRRQDLAMAGHFLPASHECRTVNLDPSSSLNWKLPAGRAGSDEGRSDTYKVLWKYVQIRQKTK